MQFKLIFYTFEYSFIIFFAMVLLYRNHHNTLLAHEVFTGHGLDQLFGSKLKVLLLDYSAKGDLVMPPHHFITFILFSISFTIFKLKFISSFSISWYSEI